MNFNVFNPEYQIFGHFSRSGDALSAMLGRSWDFINSRPPSWRRMIEDEKQKKDGKKEKQTSR